MYSKSKSEDFNNIINIGNINKTIKNKTNSDNIDNEVNIIKCKHCNNKDNNKIVKCGFSPLGKQRYKCRICGKTFLNEEDNRIKHSIAERRMCITLYLNSMSMRKIQKFLSSEFNKKIYFKSISDWIKNADKILKKEIKKEENKIITINYLCTDGHHAYNVVANHVLFKDHIKHHIVSKKENKGKVIQACL